LTLQGAECLLSSLPDTDYFMQISWVTIIWSMITSACLTLAVVHFWVWCMKRTAWASLAFAVAAVAVAAIAVGEFQIMRASTPEGIVFTMRWMDIPVAVLVTALVGFVQLNFRTGHPWLGWTAAILRFLSLFLNFTSRGTDNYREITALRQITFLGEPVTVVAKAVTNPWGHLSEFSMLLLLVFVVDAAIRFGRSGEPENRRRALLMGGSIAGFLLVSASSSALIENRLIQTPYLISFPFLAIVLVMNYELSRDIIRATELSQELREHEQQLQALLDNVPDRIYFKDLQSRFVKLNHMLVKRLGLANPEQAIGKTDFDFQLPERAREFYADEQRVMQTGEALINKTEKQIMPDGETAWTSTTKVPLRDPQGKVIGLAGINRDITQQKRAEREIEQQREELAHLSRVTTLNELSGSLAHELNQPLAIILTNAQAAQRLLAQLSPDLAEARDILADIVSEDQRAGDVIRRLRALLRPGQTHPQPLSLNEIIEDVLRIARSDLIGRSITVHRRLAENVPQVLGDRIQLQQILLNLFLNAGDAMTERPPTARLLTLTTVHLDGAVRVSVSDTGCGLPPDAERIFEPFYTTKKEGLGLGLSICRSIATAHNGRLWAEARSASAADIASGDTTVIGGTTFHLELPAMEEGKR
jgi:two-component system, LuxR family, sensor kinase FixL